MDNNRIDSLLAEAFGEVGEEGKFNVHRFRRFAHSIIDAYREEQKEPGRPLARLESLLSGLAERLPWADRPLDSRPPEPLYLAAIDRLLTQIDTLLTLRAGPKISEIARKCLTDVVAHYGATSAAIHAQLRREETISGRSYWIQELGAQKRIEAQAKAILDALGERPDDGSSTPDTSPEETFKTSGRQILRDYFYALDMREHGELAQDRVVNRFCGLLDEHWVQGQEKARRS